MACRSALEGSGMGEESELSMQAGYDQSYLLQNSQRGPVVVLRSVGGPEKAPLCALGKRYRGTGQNDMSNFVTGRRCNAHQYLEVPWQVYSDTKVRGYEELPNH